MTRPWKTLLVSVAVFQVVLSIAFWRMTDYLQWLHFSDTVVDYHGFMDTSPGRENGIFLLVTAGVLIVINIWQLTRRRHDDSEETREPEEG